VRLIKGAEAARSTILRRSPLDDRELPAAAQDLIRRVFGAELGPADVVDRILRDVRENGDAAVRRYNEAIDGVTSDAAKLPLEVSREEIKQAHSKVGGSLVEALTLAAERIRAFHEQQLAHSLKSFQDGPIGQVVRPLARAGFYVPGTAAIYPSTVLMSVIPARVAGASEVIMATPVAPDGAVAPLKLVAADIAGVDRVFRAGGVQGIAAMAYGTETVPRVDKISGPGGIFVTLAKKRLFGEVGIDGIFGPSETLVVADGRATPALVAADLLAGAEHDELASAILLTDSAELGDAVANAVDEGLASLDRSTIAKESLEARGGMILTRTIDEAIHLANEFAPEHLCLHLANAEEVMQRVTNAGCVFVGEPSVESIGDYTAGPSHVMPTGGSAAYASPLGVQDFLKVMSVVNLDQQTVDEIGPPAAAIARAEGLTGHARAVESRLSSVAAASSDLPGDSRSEDPI
jgi:histidinol dehydrogenase